MLPDAAQAADASVNSVRPAVNSLRRPKRSASEPLVSTTVARVRV